MGQSYCEENYWQTHCSDGKLTGWVSHDSILSIGADILIALALVALAWWFLWWLFDYRKRPFCVFCLQEGEKTRTKDVYKGEPACWQHLLEKTADDEPIYKCPRHNLPMEKEIDYDDGTIIDRCPQGCVFTDEQELDDMLENARSEGHASGMSTGLAVGISVGNSINSGR